MTEGKRCARCKQIKPLTEFYRYKRGYQSYCKTCSRERVYEYRRSRPKPEPAAKKRTRRTPFTPERRQEFRLWVAAYMDKGEWPRLGDNYPRPDHPTEYWQKKEKTGAIV